MLKTKAPRTSPSTMQTQASKHLWDDFVQQVASYARRVNVAHGGRPPSERRQKNVSDSCWYNKAGAEINR